MTQQGKFSRHFIVTRLVVLVVLVAVLGCTPPPVDEPQLVEETGVPAQDTPAPEPTITPISGIEPTPLPVESIRDFRAYQHVSGVFGVSVPATWEPVDQSTGQQLLVRFLPPAGYGSRVTVDIANKGPLAPPEVAALAEGYISLNFINQPNYSEVSRAELPDGRLQFVFTYNDGLGGSGREFVSFRQSGPYFSVIRAFLSDKDTVSLSGALDTIIASFVVDSLAVWGSTIESVDETDLDVRHSLLWRTEAGLTIYSGEIANLAPAVITDIAYKFNLCDEAGVVVVDYTGAPVLDRIPVGASSPFYFAFEGLPETVSVCSMKLSAIPTTHDPHYTTALSIDSSASLDSEGRLVIQGTITNSGLSSIAELEIFLTAYDEVDAIVGYARLLPIEAGSLLPGATQGFRYVFDELAAPAVRFQAVGQARVLSTLNPVLPADGSGSG